MILEKHLTIKEARNEIEKLENERKELEEIAKFF